MDSIKYAELMRDYRKAIAPLIKAKADLYSIATPKITIFNDGRIESGFTLPERLQESVKHLDEAIINAQAKIFGPHLTP